MTRSEAVGMRLRLLAVLSASSMLLLGCAYLTVIKAYPVGTFSWSAAATVPDSWYTRYSATAPESVLVFYSAEDVKLLYEVIGEIKGAGHPNHCQRELCDPFNLEYQDLVQRDLPTAQRKAAEIGGHAIIVAQMWGPERKTNLVGLGRAGLVDTGRQTLQAKILVIRFLDDSTAPNSDEPHAPRP